MSTPAAVVFDLFGTLADFPARDHDQVVASMAGCLVVDLVAYRRHYTSCHVQQEEGYFPDVAAYIRHIVDALGARCAAERVEAAVELRSCFTRRLLLGRPDAAAALAAVRRGGYRTALISNCPPEVPPLWPASPLAEHFEVAIFSCAWACASQSPRIYQLACERLRVVPGDCLYVGDGGSRELSGAAAVGMQAIQLRLTDEDA